MNEACTPTAASLDSYRNAQAWYGPQLDKHPEYWVHHLTGPELEQLDRAVRHADAGGKDITELSQDDFELGELGQRLQQVKHEVLHGRGLYLIRGVPVEQYTMRQSAIAFWALGTNLGLPVSQNGKGGTYWAMSPTWGWIMRTPPYAATRPQPASVSHGFIGHRGPAVRQAGEGRRTVLGRQLHDRLERTGRPSP